VNPRVQEIDAEGRPVGDEVDFVSAVGERHAELGGDDAAPAVGGVTRDRDSHSASPAVPGTESPWVRCSGLRLPGRPSPTIQEVGSATAGGSCQRIGSP
jgi:hypothetical protein